MLIGGGYVRPTSLKHSAIRPGAGCTHEHTHNYHMDMRRDIKDLAHEQQKSAGRVPCS